MRSIDAFPALSAALVLACGALAGCADNDFKDFNRLDSLRVLALKANAPEVAASQGGVTVQPLISDVGGNGRALVYSAETCIDPGVSLGAAPSCDGSASRQVIAANQPVPNALIVSNGYTASQAPIPVAIPTAAAVFENRTEADRHNGVGLLFIYRLRAPDGATVTSMKRILVSEKTPKNQNPMVNTVYFNGQPVNFTLPNGSGNFRIVFPASSRESYVYKDSSGASIPLQETLTSTWFISDGEAQRYRTLNEDENLWNPPTSQPEGLRKVTVVVVIRDGRGGEEWGVVSYNNP